MSLEASDVLIAIAEISVALVGFTGIIAAFRQRSISNWPPHVAYRFSFMCWNAFSAMAFSLFPFVLFYETRLAEQTWQISSVLFAISCFLIVWLTYSGAKRLPTISRASLNKGWMMTYQSGSLASGALLIANAVSLLGDSGPAIYLLALGWQLFFAASLFYRLLVTPVETSE